MGSRRQCAAEGANLGVQCCVTDTTTRLHVDLLAGDCLFVHEAVSYPVAAARCAVRGGSLCTTGSNIHAYEWLTCANSAFYWSSEACALQVQVYPDGKIGIVDDSITDARRPFRGYVQNSFDTFAVRWTSATVPTAPNCGTGCSVATTIDGDTCLCAAAVTDSAPFAAGSPPTLTALETTLFQAALPPSTYDAGEYVQCVSGCPTGGYTVWTHTTDGAAVWTARTIFQLPPAVVGAAPRFLFNKASTVSVGDASFRNPPHFMPGTGASL
jgi:hypothetical protein